MLYKYKAVVETRAGGSSAYNMPTSPDGKTPLGVPITAILLRSYFAFRRKMSPLKVFIISSAPPPLILP